MGQRIPAKLRDAIGELKKLRDQHETTEGHLSIGPAYYALTQAADRVVNSAAAPPMPSGKPVRLSREACEALGWGNVARIRHALGDVAAARVAYDESPTADEAIDARRSYDAAVDELLAALDRAGFLG